MITETNQAQSPEIEVIAQEITGTVERAYSVLLKRRETAFAAANGPLAAEEESLRQEHASIGEAAGKLSELFPAMARMAQAEHDRLLLAGDREGAAAKLAEQKEAEHAAEGMCARQAAINTRLTAILDARKEIAKTIFEGWYAELQKIVRASEHALFISLLDAGKD